MNNLTKDNLAVMLIDMQPTYLSKISNSEKLIANQKQVLRVCNRKNIPLVVLEFKGRGDTTPELREIYKHNSNYKTFLKDDLSGFFGNESVYPWLYNHGIENIFLMGVYASACVLATAKDALEKKFKLYTSRDTIEDVNNEGETIKEGILGWYEENTTYAENFWDFEIFRTKINPIIAI